MTNPFRVLLVEDEPVIRELVQGLLTDSDVHVECATTGIDGLRLARSQAFDLILLDVVLPQLDGITVCRMLRADPSTARVPLHMLTAKAKRVDVEIAMKAGADGYIHKPFRGAELMDLVNSLKAKKATSPQGKV